ncbi:MAG TPA: transcriptional regulator [Bryobacterales bacterium]|nr:transcriptional regulator [Bryobacterales bacterium]
MKEYHYTGCGLDNVIIYGADFLTDDGGDEVLVIPAVNRLHRVIAEGIVRRPGRMTGKELRFLRTEMGMTPAELAALLHRDAQSVARWEKGRVEMDGNADTLMRLLAAEHLDLKLREGAAELSRRCADTPPSNAIRIRADDDRYELMEAA